MKLYVGTSGFGYKGWNGKFYPKDLPATQMLNYYSKCFGAVEINNTFYRMPEPSVFEAWIEEVREDFQFAIKSPRQITHTKRLKDTSDLFAHLFQVAGVLGNRLAPFLFQLPPTFKKDIQRLQEFLGLLPKSCRATFEFRHQSWFEEDVFQLLRNHQAALCIAEDDNGLNVPIVPTTNWGYLRLRRLDYVDADLKRWAKTINSQPWQHAYVFFKHEDQAKGPAFAARFMEFLG